MIPIAMTRLLALTVIASGWLSGPLMADDLYLYDRPILADSGQQTTFINRLLNLGAAGAWSNLPTTLANWDQTTTPVKPSWDSDASNYSSGNPTSTVTSPPPLPTFGITYCNGSLYVFDGLPAANATGTTRLYQLALSGSLVNTYTYTNSILNASLSYTCGLASDGTYLYVFNQAAKCIYRLPTNGNPVSEVIDIDPNGLLSPWTGINANFVYYNNAFWIYDNEGQYLDSINSTSGVVTQYHVLSSFLYHGVNVIPVGRGLAVSNGVLYLGDYGVLPGTTQTHAIWPITISGGTPVVGAPTPLPWTTSGVSPGNDYPVNLVYVPMTTPVATIATTTNAAESPSGGTQGTFTVSLTSLSPPSGLQIPYTVTAASTAISGRDYTALSGTVTVPANATSATIAVKPIDNHLDTGPLTVVVTINAGSGYTVSPTNATSTLTISDYEEPTVTITASAPNAEEPWTSGAKSFPGQYTVMQTVNAGVSLPQLHVTYNLAGTQLSDVSLAPTGDTVTIPAGSASALITATPLFDAAGSYPQLVIPTLSSNAASPYLIGSSNTATVIINSGTYTVTNANYTNPIPNTYGDVIISSSNGTTVTLPSSGIAGITAHFQIDIKPTVTIGPVSGSTVVDLKVLNQ